MLLLKIIDVYLWLVIVNVVAVAITTAYDYYKYDKSFSRYEIKEWKYSIFFVLIPLLGVYVSIWHFAWEFKTYWRKNK